MARNIGPRTPDDQLASRTLASDSAGSRVSTVDDLDSRLLDLDIEHEAPFLRVQKRVPVRRGALPRKAANRLKIAVAAMALLGAAGVIAVAIYRYGSHSWRFRLQSSDAVEISGTRHVTRAQVMDVLGADIGRNVFFIPLEQRRKQLEQIAWVESASVARLLPDHIRVDIRERTPVAFAKIGPKVHLVDAGGVVMDLPAARRGAPPDASQRYSFPVILGMAEAEPLSTRAARMKLYASLIEELDSGGARYSQDLSEVDLSDPEDVKITTSDPAGGVVIHLGASNFLDRYKIYIGNVQQWRRQYPNLRSVDLRYDRQVILDGDPPASTAASVSPPKPRSASAKLPLARPKTQLRNQSPARTRKKRN